MQAGKAFGERHGVTFPLLWEAGYEAWSGFGITRQPASVLVSKDGQELKRYLGSLRPSDLDEIKQTISES